MAEFHIRAIFRNYKGDFLFAMEQAIPEHDTIENAVRRFGRRVDKRMNVEHHDYTPVKCDITVRLVPALQDGIVEGERKLIPEKTP